MMTHFQTRLKMETVSPYAKICRCLMVSFRACPLSLTYCGAGALFMASMMNGCSQRSALMLSMTKPPMTPARHAHPPHILP